MARLRAFRYGVLLLLAVGLLSWGGAGLTPHLTAWVEQAVWATDQAAPQRVLLTLHAQVNPAVVVHDLPLPARRAALVAALREQAQVSQRALLADLEAAGIDYRAYWLVNTVAVDVPREQLLWLAQHPAVARISSDAWVRATLATVEAGPAPAPTAVEWGVAKVNADAVWALGHTGQGVVIGNTDTGIDWDHPALIDSYRGWNGTSADHNYHWWDAIHVIGSSCGADSPVPCDDNGHGTHTVGTSAGQGGIGVAPGADWISCRNMNSGWGSPSTYLECWQFMLAPTDLAGQNPNPALGADIISNSFGCTYAEGCTADTELTAAADNLRAAGVFMAVSAGNSGSGCSTIYDPPGLIDSVISIGATDSTDGIASFSSRGPTAAGLLKPDLVAPGVWVRSSTPGGGYGTLSGTSMAAPHVAGVVALLWSAVPMLKNDVDATEALLRQTAQLLTSAQTCGGVPGSQTPNNTFGYGRIDALAAYVALLPYRIYFPIVGR